MTLEHAKQHLRDYYTIHPGMPMVPYKPVRKLKDIHSAREFDRRAPGAGQSKLLISEMRFFETYYNIICPPLTTSRHFAWPRDKVADFSYHYRSVVMYVGASDGHHLAQYTQIYPGTLFILVDPRAPHNGLKAAEFKNTHFIREKWEREEDVDRFFADVAGPGPDIRQSKVPVIFISDIRSKNTRIVPVKEGDEAVEKDQKTQTLLLQAIRKKALVPIYMVKFRAPFEFAEDNIGTRMQGELWVQSYAPHSSSELRIVGKCPPLSDSIGTEPYMIKQLEDVMAFINTGTRVHGHFDAHQAACVVSLMRENRKNLPLPKDKDDYDDVFRFMASLLGYNLPYGDQDEITLASRVAL